MSAVVYVLIGPKGAGKSYVGKLLDREFGIKFLSIEEIFIKLQGKGISTPDVQERGYRMVEDRVSQILAKGNAASFEITVLSPMSEKLLDQLGQRAHIETIQIYAPLELCLARIKTRDASKHIEISEEKIVEVNTLSVNQQINARLRIDTSTMSDKEIVDKFRTIYDK